MDHQVFLRQGHVLVHLPATADSQSIYLAWDTKQGKTHLKSIVEIAHFAKVVQELVDPSLVILHERVQRHHILLLGVRGLVRQVLQHLRNLCNPSTHRKRSSSSILQGDKYRDTYQGERSSRVLRGHAVDEHVRLWRHDSRVDKSQEEESTNKRADRVVCRLRVLPLHSPNHQTNRGRRSV